MVSYDRKILPGGKGKITLKVSTRNRRGKLLKRALIISNDRSAKIPILSISGEIKSLIYVKPRLFVFLNGIIGDKISEDVRIVAGAIQQFSIKKIDSNLENKISYGLLTVKKGKEYILHIENKYRKEGSYYGYITLITDNPEKPKIIVRVSGRITGELIAIPRTLFFGRISAKYWANGKRILAREFFVKNLKKRPFNIVGLKYDKNLFNVQILPSRDQGIFKLKVLPKLDQFKKGSYFGLLKIKTDIPNSREISVALRIFIQ